MGVSSMKRPGIVAGVVILILGGLVGHVNKLSSSVKAETSVAQVSPFELTMNASNLPVESFDAF
jgi:hypothetical protein